MLEKVAVVCFIFCFGVVEDSPPRKLPTSDFCKRYERQVLTPEENESLKELPQRLRDRIQGNDLDYLCQCLKWKDEACRLTQKPSSQP